MAKRNDDFFVIYPALTEAVFYILLTAGHPPPHLSILLCVVVVSPGQLQKRRFLKLNWRPRFDLSAEDQLAAQKTVDKYIACRYNNYIDSRYSGMRYIC